MMFAAVEIVRGETIYRSRNDVQTNPATSVVRHGRSVMVRAAQPVNRDDHAEDATCDAAPPRGLVAEWSRAQA
jgi:hypothetical protein